MKLLLTGCLIIMFCCGSKLRAQPFSLDERVVPVELSFRDFLKQGEAKPNGRIAQEVYEQEADTAYYFVKGLSMYSPTYVGLSATDADADIKVHLCQANWVQANQSGEVKGATVWDSKFKTEGDIGIMVIARIKPVRYVLTVWTGKELNLVLPSVFKGPAEATAGGGIWGWFIRNKILSLVILVSLGVIGFLAFKLKNKKS